MSSLTTALSKELSRPVCRVLQVLSERGFRAADDNTFENLQYEVLTPLGTLTMHIGDRSTKLPFMVFGRFREPELATRRGLDSNPYTGKWNHFAPKPGFDAWLKEFAQELDRVLLDQPDWNFWLQASPPSAVSVTGQWRFMLRRRDALAGYRGKQGETVSRDSAQYFTMGDLRRLWRNRRARADLVVRYLPIFAGRA